MKTGAIELRAILEAYKKVMEASWPNLHPAMAVRATQWASASEADLSRELNEYIHQASTPGCQVRVFWKLLPGFVFGGCNARFAADAGLRSASDMVGLDDYSSRLPWVLQAAKYRADDQAIVSRGAPMLNIVERQQSKKGISWVRVGKTPIRTADGAVIGLFGMYEPMDAETGGRLFVQGQRAQQAR
jgi:hypothetical protein